MKTDLKSSVEKQGKRVTQIITGLGGIKKTFRGVKTETIEQGQFTHFETEDGRLIMINDKNVLWVEVFKEQTIHDPMENCDDPNCRVCTMKI